MGDFGALAGRLDKLGAAPGADALAITSTETGACAHFHLLTGKLTLHGVVCSDPVDSVDADADLYSDAIGLTCAALTVEDTAGEGHGGASALDALSMHSTRLNSFAAAEACQASERSSSDGCSWIEVKIPSSQ